MSVVVSALLSFSDVDVRCLGCGGFVGHSRWSIFMVVSWEHYLCPFTLPISFKRSKPCATKSYCGTSNYNDNTIVEVYWLSCMFRVVVPARVRTYSSVLRLFLMSVRELGALDRSLCLSEQRRKEREGACASPLLHHLLQGGSSFTKPAIENCLRQSKPLVCFFHKHRQHCKSLIKHNNSHSTTNQQQHSSSWTLLLIPTVTLCNP